MTLALSNHKNGSRLPMLLDEMFKPDWFFPAASDFFNRFADRDFLVVPEANVIENKDNYEIELAAPGLDRDDFKIEIDDNVLNISAKKEEEHESEDKSFRRKEFSYNSFRRSFTLPDNLKADKIDAKYEKGVLRLTLPKKTLGSPKAVKQIKVG